MIIRFNYYNQDVLVEVEEQDASAVKEIVIEAVKANSQEAEFDLSSIISQALIDANYGTAKVIEDDLYVALDDLCENDDYYEDGYTVVAHKDDSIFYKEHFDDLTLAEIVAKEVSEMISDVYGKNYVDIIDSDGDVYNSYSNYNADKTFDLKKIEEIIERFTKK